MRFKDKENFPEKYVISHSLVGSVVAAVPNAEKGLVFDVSVGINSTLSNPINMRRGDDLTFILRQGASYTLAFGDKFLFIGGAYVISTGGAAVDVIKGIYDGTNILIHTQAKAIA
jgi:hypothetical protein